MATCLVFGQCFELSTDAGGCCAWTMRSNKLNELLVSDVRYGWSQHLKVADVLAAADPSDQGAALALLGVALLMLAQDLLLQECAIMLPLE